MGPEAEQRPVVGRRRHHGRRALAADMAVQADHPVGGRHHHVQVVADHQHAAAELLAQLLDQPVEARLAGLVEPLRRLVEHQQVRPPQHRLRQHRPLQLPARQRRQLPTAEPGDADMLERRGPLAPAPPPGEREEAVDGQRQRPVDRELLRHVADPQPRRADHPARVRPSGADQQPQQRALARAVRPDDRDDLAGLQRQATRRAAPRWPPKRDAEAAAPRSARSRRVVPAARAEALGLDHHPLDREAGRGRPRPPAPRGGRQRGLRDPAAGAADQEARAMRRARRGRRRRRRRAARSGARSRCATRKSSAR